MEIVPGSAVLPPRAARISVLQEEFEQLFPPAYLAFLQRYNGARPTNNEVTSAHGTFVVERFLPILDDPKIDAANGWADVAVVASQLSTRLVTDGDRTGVELIPIAALFGGDFLVLDYRSSAQYPVVARWDHEASDDFAPETTPVAGSFEMFERLLD